MQQEIEVAQLQIWKTEAPLLLIIPTGFEGVLQISINQVTQLSDRHFAIA